MFLQKVANYPIANGKTGVDHVKTLCRGVESSPTSLCSSEMSFSIHTPSETGSVKVYQNDLYDDLPSVPVYSGVEGEERKTNAACKYGYEEAAPDESNKYGYEEAAPDELNKYGYEEAAPDNGGNYGIEPSPAHYSTLGTEGAPRRDRASRRSSMKQHGQPRRSSIQFNGEREVSLPNCGRKVKRRTSITFNESVHVKPVTRVSDLTKEAETLWFQDEDYSKMREKCYRLVDTVEAGLVPTDSKRKPCLRGLEGLMVEYAEEKVAARYQCWDSVLDEQHMQMSRHSFDDQAMANAYKLCSIQSRLAAVRRAKEDEKEVQGYLKSTRRMCRRLSC